MTPQETTKRLGDMLVWALNQMVERDMQDPDFWKEAGIDYEAFTKVMREDGARVMVSLTFTPMKPKHGLAILSPREFGITGAEPEAIMAEVELEPFGE